MRGGGCVNPKKYRASTSDFKNNSSKTTMTKKISSKHSAQSPLHMQLSCANNYRKDKRILECCYNKCHYDCINKRGYSMAVSVKRINVIAI